jgi:pyridoxamine 5'-phosphate oxidase
METDPIVRFRRLLGQARKAKLREPTAMILATADAKGRPSARTVLLKGADDRGFTFYTNLQSRKGRELSANRRAALCFYWEPLESQVIVEGKVKPVSKEEAYILDLDALPIEFHPQVFFALMKVGPKKNMRAVGNGVAR